MGSNDLYAYLDHWNIDATAIVNGLNQATSVGGDTVTYDAKGNVTSYDGKSYTYDAENFLTAANGYTISYDAAGRFHQRTKSGVDPRKALYAGDRMIALYKGDDTVNNYFIHGASVDEPIVRRNPGGVRRFLIKDERGSVIASTKDDGSVATDNTYDAYGRNGDTNAGRFQYTGQQWWGDFGLYYYKARWYNPELGRFMQTDPIGYGDGMNMYAYVGGDPVNYTDPWGMESCDPKDSEECEPTDPDGTGEPDSNQQQTDVCIGLFDTIFRVSGCVTVDGSLTNAQTRRLANNWLGFIIANDGAHISGYSVNTNANSDSTGQDGCSGDGCVTEIILVAATRRGDRWENHSDKWVLIADGRANPRAFEPIPRGFREIRVWAQTVGMCAGDVAAGSCGGGSVALWWGRSYVDSFGVYVSGRGSKRTWQLDGYSGYRVRFDFVGAGDYTIHGRY